MVCLMSRQLVSSLKFLKDGVRIGPLYLSEFIASELKGGSVILVRLTAHNSLLSVIAPVFLPFNYLLTIIFSFEYLSGILNNFFCEIS